MQYPPTPICGGILNKVCCVSHRSGILCLSRDPIRGDSSLVEVLLGDKTRQDANTLFYIQNFLNSSANVHPSWRSTGKRHLSRLLCSLLNPGYDVKLHTAVVHLLSSLCRSLRHQFSPIEVLVAMPMTRWEFRIFTCLAGGNASASCLKMLVMHLANVQWPAPLSLLQHFAAQYKFLVIIKLVPLTVVDLYLTSSSLSSPTLGRYSSSSSSSENGISRNLTSSSSLFLTCLTGERVHGGGGWKEEKQWTQ